MEVRAEFALSADIRLDQRLADVQPVVLGLAHEGLGNGRHRGLALDGAVRIDVGHLCVPHAEDVHRPVGAVHIAGDAALDDLEALNIPGDGQSADAGQIRDEVPRPVVRRPQDVAKLLPLPKELHYDVLLIVESKLPEFLHFFSLSHLNGSARLPLSRSSPANCAGAQPCSRQRSPNVRDHPERLRTVIDAQMA